MLLLEKWLIVRRFGIPVPLNLCILNSLNLQDKARLLAVSAPHSGDWLKTLPLSSCGLPLDDEAVRVAVGLRLGSSLCEPHTCICGTAVNALGTHGLACKRSAGRFGRHQYLNDIIGRALNRVTFPRLKRTVYVSSINVLIR